MLPAQAAGGNSAVMDEISRDLNFSFDYLARKLLVLQGPQIRGFPLKKSIADSNHEHCVAPMMCPYIEIGVERGLVHPLRFPPTLHIADRSTTMIPK